MQISIDGAIGILGRTPAVLDALLRGQPESWLQCVEGIETFSPMDVLGHLVFGEITDWIPRAKIILDCGESRAFDPFDRVGFRPLIEGRTVEHVLDQFAELRARNIDALRGFHLSEADFQKKGKHPELGSVTLGQLLATWVVHDLTHLSQVVRVMAKQYGEEVGPWRAYLSILK